MSTYCYTHGLVDPECNQCLSEVARMLRGEYPYRDDITALDAYSAYFPQVHPAKSKTPPPSHEG